MEIRIDTQEKTIQVDGMNTLQDLDELRQIAATLEGYRICHGKIALPTMPIYPAPYQYAPNWVYPYSWPTTNPYPLYPTVTCRTESPVTGTVIFPRAGDIFSFTTARA